MKTVESGISLPAQHEGKEKNIEEAVETSNKDEAIHLFTLAKERLLNVNQWHTLCGNFSAVFQLTDEKGNHITTTPAVGNYFKIDIPGPGTIAGKGYDWVRVEAIEEKTIKENDEENILIRVRPSDNPTTGNNNVAHFFSDKATSNFFLSRVKNVVMAAVYGRNETPNTTTNNPLDKTRNAVVGTSAAAGISDPQWKALINGVLGNNK